MGGTEWILSINLNLLRISMANRQLEEIDFMVMPRMKMDAS